MYASICAIVSNSREITPSSESDAKRIGTVVCSSYSSAVRYQTSGFVIGAAGRLLAGRGLLVLGGLLDVRLLQQAARDHVVVGRELFALPQLDVADPRLDEEAVLLAGVLEGAHGGAKERRSVDDVRVGHF